MIYWDSLPLKAFTFNSSVGCTKMARRSFEAGRWAEAGVMWQGRRPLNYFTIKSKYAIANSRVGTGGS
jgi:hypothetical protein